MSDIFPTFYEQDESWKQHAACRDIPTDMFFPARGESVTAVKQICAECPVRQECLDYSLNIPNCVGIWGGLSGRERRNYRRDLRIAENAAPIRHGTSGGYHAEIRRGLEPCSQCQMAHREYERQRARDYRNRKNSPNR